MIVGTDEPDRDRGDHEHIDGPKLRVADPQYRCDGADHRRMARREGCVTNAAMEWIESVDVVADQGWIAVDPGFRPSSTETKFELVFDCRPNSQADAANQKHGVKLRQVVSDGNAPPHDDKGDDRQNSEALGNEGQPRQR